MRVLLLALALLALLAAAPAAAAEAPPQFAVRAGAAPAAVVPGQGFATDVEVTNFGPAAIHVFVEAANPEWTFERTEPADAIRIAPGRTHTWRQTINVSLHAPNGTHVIRIFAMPLEDVSAAKHADLHVRIVEPPGGRPEGGRGLPSPPPTTPPRMLLFAQESELLEVPAWGEAKDVLLLANSGERAATLAPRLMLGPGFSSRFADVTFEPATVHLPPGATERLTVRVRAFPDAPAGEVHQLPFALDHDGSSSFAWIAVRFVAPPAPVDSFQLVVLGAPVTALGVTIAVLRRREDLWWKVMAPFAPLFTRLAKSEVLDHTTRDRLLALVRARPGIFWHEVKEATKLPTGALVHHLRTLERHGFVVSQRLGRRLRFFPAGARTPDPAPVPTTAQARVLAALDAGPLTQREIAVATGLTQQGVSYHLGNLERKGTVLVRPGRGGERRYVRVHELRPAGGPPADPGVAFK